MQVGIAKRALDGQTCSGDDCRWWRYDGTMVLCVADGVGHGRHAMRAARAALSYVARHLSDPLTDVFARCDQALRSTRGAAMGIAVVDEEVGTLMYAGVGNTRAMVVSGSDSVSQQARAASGGARCAGAAPGRQGRRWRAAGAVHHLSSSYGLVGGGYKKLLLQCTRIRPGDLVILCTDGVEEMIDMSRYNGALRADVGWLAETIIGDWRRGTDDAAVMVFRKGTGQQREGD